MDKDRGVKRELVIISPPGGGDLFYWRLREGGRSKCGQGSAAEIAEIGHDRLVCLIAGEDVFISREARPPGRERQVQKAIPFVIEEKLAADIDSVHVAAGPAPDGGGLLVAAVAKERLDSLLAELKTAGLVPDLIAPDFLALPWQPDRLTLLVTGDRFIARLSDGTGAAMEKTALAAWLKLALAEDGDRDAELVVYDCGGVGDGIPDSARIVEGPQDWPLLLAADAPFASPLDFLSGEYKNRGRLRSLPPFMLAPAVLLAVWSGLFCLSRGIDYVRVSRAEKELSAAAEAVYRRAFPGETTVVNPRLQMERKLAASTRRAGGDFLPVLAKIAPELLRASGFNLRRLRYDGRRIVLEMDLASIAEFDRVRGAVAAKLGRTVKTGQIRKKGSGVRGELRIETGEGRR